MRAVILKYEENISSLNKGIFKERNDLLRMKAKKALTAVTKVSVSKTEKGGGFVITSEIDVYDDPSFPVENELLVENIYTRHV